MLSHGGICTGYMIGGQQTTNFLSVVLLFYYGMQSIYGTKSTTKLKHNLFTTFTVVLEVVYGLMPMTEVANTTTFPDMLICTTS
jgi:hypothetical protein